jgi:hypothetical protein
MAQATLFPTGVANVKNSYQTLSLINSYQATLPATKIELVCQSESLNPGEEVVASFPKLAVVATGGLHLQ